MNLGTFGLDTNTLLIWAGLGLFAGVIAKYLLPGKDKGGIISTALIGILGAFVGGLVGKYFGIATEIGGLSLMSIVTAIVGAIIVLLAKRVLKILI